VQSRKFGHLTSDRGDDAFGHRTLETERAADCHYDSPDAQVIGVAEDRRAQIRRGDPDDRKVV
jgi:hypothetical protein